MNHYLEGKKAIVTGGSKGLGADIALALAKAGATVVILGRDLEGLKKTQALIEQQKGTCFIIQADLHDNQAIIEASKQILRLHPGWDILVNNAGISKASLLLETSAEDWDELYSINLRAVFLLSKYIVPQMIQRKAGKIINISSLGTFYGTPGLGAYSASKAGLNQLTKTMAIEWGRANIQINAICPTVVLTDMGKLIWEDPTRQEMKEKIESRIPLKRFAQPKEISDLVVFLAGPGSDFMNGCIIPIDDGAHLNPA
ncbi:SDR family NAD(P)-dependent oxidoreductase [Legionella sp. km772]|uniref:SDR family NAD(P)-dependent oxidoreductase n=1 Tax=Legionella sp. km772 TaxID=2498111 RepID=UPI0013151538|nr:SDR family oxidoreductase [Legionella sp. km772]